MSKAPILPGFYQNITGGDYHSGPGISKSHLDQAAVSGLHYWAKYIDPNREPEKATPAKILGDATHKAILEPDLLTKRYIARPDGIDGRTKEGKAALAELQAQAAGRTILSADDYKTVVAVRDAVHRHPLASGLLKNGAAEQSFYAVDDETGELVKCRTDWLCTTGLVVDVKTTDDASPSAFARSVGNYRYHVQDAWYSDVMKAAVGEPPSHFVFIAVEKEWPHAIGVYFLSDEDRATGRSLARRDLTRILQCRSAGIWPDFASEPVELRLPAWARNQSFEG